MSEVAVLGLREEAVARANVYHTLALSVASPTLWPTTFADEIGPRFSVFGDRVILLSQILADSVEIASTQKEKLIVAHSQLFVGPYGVGVAPWASMYLDDQKQLMGAVSQFVAEAYAEAGLGPAQGRKDAPDHIEHEFEFMYFLAFNEAEARDPIWEDRQKRFWRGHLSQWLPEFAFSLRKVAQHPFYGALAELLLAYFEEEKKHFEGISLP